MFVKTKQIIKSFLICFFVSALICFSLLSLLACSSDSEKSDPNVVIIDATSSTEQTDSNANRVNSSDSSVSLTMGLPSYIPPWISEDITSNPSDEPVGIDDVGPIGGLYWQPNGADYAWPISLTEETVGTLATGQKVIASESYFRGFARLDREQGHLVYSDSCAGEDAGKTSADVLIVESSGYISSYGTDLNNIAYFNGEFVGDLDEEELKEKIYNYGFSLLGFGSLATKSGITGYRFISPDNTKSFTVREYIVRERSVNGKLLPEELTDEKVCSVNTPYYTLAPHDISKESPSSGYYRVHFNSIAANCYEIDLSDIPSGRYQILGSMVELV